MRPQWRGRWTGIGDWKARPSAYREAANGIEEDATERRGSDIAEDETARCDTLVPCSQLPGRKVEAVEQAMGGVQGWGECANHGNWRGPTFMAMLISHARPCLP